MRIARILFVIALTLSIAGAAWAGGACDKEKASAEKATVQKSTIEKVSTEKAASHCSEAHATVKMASASGGKECTAAEKAACASTKAAMASAHADCPFCGFMAEYNATKGKVTMSTVDSESGLVVVFAGVSKSDVAAAQAMADKAFAMMSAPGHCAATKADMAEKSCDGCKEGLEAFSHAQVSLEKTETGAQTLVKVEKQEQVEKLHHFFATLGQEEKTQG